MVLTSRFLLTEGSMGVSTISQPGFTLYSWQGVMKWESSQLKDLFQLPTPGKTF